MGTTESDETCVIFGHNVNGVVCWCGLALLGLFLLLVVASSVAIIIRVIYRRCIVNQSSLPEFRRKISQFLDIPVGKLPTCLLLHLYDSLGSEKCQTWVSLVRIHDLRLSPNVTVQSANTQILTEYVLKEIVRVKKDLFTLDVLLRDLVDSHREDTVMRLVKHLDRCLGCTENMARFVRSSGNVSGNGSAESLVRTESLQSFSSTERSFCALGNTSYWPINGSGTLMNTMDPFGDSSPTPPVDITFWEKYGDKPIIQGEPYCIMERVYSFFTAERCSVLKQFYGLKRWPDRPHFLAYLERTNPAKTFFTAFLCARPQYTYWKLKRDLERLQQHFIVRDIAEHYVAQECPHCSDFTSSYENPSPKGWKIEEKPQSNQTPNDRSLDSGLAISHGRTNYSTRCETVVQVHENGFVPETRCDPRGRIIALSH